MTSLPTKTSCQNGFNKSYRKQQKYVNKQIRTDQIFRRICLLAILCIYHKFQLTIGTEWFATTCYERAQSSFKIKLCTESNCKFLDVPCLKSFNLPGFKLRRKHNEVGLEVKYRSNYLTLIPNKIDCFARGLSVNCIKLKSFQ